MSRSWVGRIFGTKEVSSESWSSEDSLWYERHSKLSHHITELFYQSPGAQEMLEIVEDTVRPYPWIKNSMPPLEWIRIE